LLADGIPPLQHLVHEALIDDRDVHTRREIGGTERATGDDRGLQHVEIRWLDARDGRLVERQRCTGARVAGRPSGDGRVLGKLYVVLRAGSTGKPVYEGNARDRWLRCHPAAQLLDGGRKRRTLGGAGRLGVRSGNDRRIHLDPHCQKFLGGKSGGERLDVTQLPLLHIDDRGECHREPRPARQ
jgi:hypothetical protein